MAGRAGSSVSTVPWRTTCPRAGSAPDVTDASASAARFLSALRQMSAQANPAKRIDSVRKTTMTVLPGESWFAAVGSIILGHGEDTARLPLQIQLRSD